MVRYDEPLGENGEVRPCGMATSIRAGPNLPTLDFGCGVNLKLAGSGTADIEEERDTENAGITC